MPVKPVYIKKYINYYNSFLMENKVLITGAAGVLGTVVTQYFLEKKIPVTALAGPQDDPGFIRHELLTVFSGDLSDEKEASKIFERAVSASAPIAMAVFIAGGFSMGKLKETGVKEIRNMFSLNFETAYSSARFMFNYFQEKGEGGRMVFIGAKPGLDTGQASGMVAYGLSKSLIFSLADLINGAGQKDGIDAAVIVPGTIDTPGNRKGMPEADFSKWVSPGSIADTIFFLYSEAGKELKEPVFKIYGKS